MKAAQLIHFGFSFFELSSDSIFAIDISDNILGTSRRYQSRA